MSQDIHFSQDHLLNSREPRNGSPDKHLLSSPTAVLPQKVYRAPKGHGPRGELCLVEMLNMAPGTLQSQNWHLAEGSVQTAWAGGCSWG